MGLFQKSKKSIFDKPQNRFKFKEKRKISGKTSITQTATPYRAKPFFSGLKKKKKFGKPSQNLFVPPARINQAKPSKIKKILIILVVLAGLGSGIYAIFFTDWLIINEYQIYEEGVQITNNLKLNEILSRNLIDQNLLFFNDSQIKIDLLSNNPEYKDVQFKKLFPHTLSLELEKYPISANIIDQIEGTDGLRMQKKFLVNSNGMIILENEENPDLPYLKVYSTQALKINDYPLPQGRLEYIIKLINLFEEKFGIKVIEAEYWRQAREVHLRTEKNFVVWFDLNKDMLEQIDKLKRALPKLDIYKTPLQYIDLRVSGTNSEKVIFKTR